MTAAPAAPASGLADVLGPEVVEIVDIGANPIDGDPPYRALLDSGLARVTGFEPQAAALARLRAAAGPAERYLPYAVGDGGRHLLSVCAESGFTSLLQPDPEQLALLTDFPRLAAVTEQVEVDTVRLDDIAEIERIDYLKIDIQGGELAVFNSGARAIADTLAVQTEVNFFRLYRDQPTFADVDLRLRALGFVPQQFVSVKTWPLTPVQWADPLQSDARQLVEADVLYVRDLTALSALDDAQVRRLALIAHLGYRAFGVALRCVEHLVSRGAVPADAVARYRGLTQH